MLFVFRVYSRHSGLALGKFSLNISGIPPGSDYPVVLCNFLKELVTKVKIIRRLGSVSFYHHNCLSCIMFVNTPVVSVDVVWCQNRALIRSR